MYSFMFAQPDMYAFRLYLLSRNKAFRTKQPKEVRDYIGARSGVVAIIKLE